MKVRNTVSDCKQVTGRNNKHVWGNPEPAIRVGRTHPGQAGTKVAILTRYDTIVLE